MVYMKKQLMIFTSLILSVILLASCTGGGGTAAGGDAAIRVSSKDFTEQLILGQITILALRENGIEAIDMTNIAGTENVRRALETGDVDIYWEYTGTAWMMLMGNELIPGETPTQLFERVRATDAEAGVVWLNYAPLNNTYALAVTQEMSQEHGLHSISDLAALSQTMQLRFATEHEFIARPDGLQGIIEIYGVNFDNLDLRTMFTGLVYDTLAAGQVDVGVVFSTDGRIPHLNLVVLEDDLYFFPIYNPAPNVRTDTLERLPQIADILNPIAVLLTDDVAQHLNFLVDSGQMEPDEAAAYWLRSEGFIN